MARRNCSGNVYKHHAIPPRRRDASLSERGCRVPGGVATKGARSEMVLFPSPLLQNWGRRPTGPEQGSPPVSKSANAGSVSVLRGPRPTVPTIDDGGFATERRPFVRPDLFFRLFNRTDATQTLSSAPYWTSVQFWTHTVQTARRGNERRGVEPHTHAVSPGCLWWGSTNCPRPPARCTAAVPRRAPDRGRRTGC